MVFIFRQRKTQRYTCSDVTPRQCVYRPLVSDLLTVCQIDEDTALIPHGLLQPQGNGENAVWDANEKPQTEREQEREKETDKEWTGLDAVVTHTDCYIHIYNRVRSDRRHLNLHLFYSFCLSLFSLFLSLCLSFWAAWFLALFSPFLWLATEVLICPPIGQELSLSFSLSHFLSFFP